VEEAGVPPRWVPLVPRPRRRADVDAVEAEPEAVTEQVLEHV